MAETTRLILASASRARRGLLAAAGVTFDVIPADVDEAAIRGKLAAEPPEKIAAALAGAKAEAVGSLHPDALVIGADQVLALGNEIFEKSTDADDARAVLEHLRGKTHALHTGVALAERGKTSWSHVETARLKMRRFTDAFLAEYLERVGDNLRGMLGAYHLEGLGAQLFDNVEGDYFTILGLPLLPLLGELRARGILAS